VVVLKPGLVLKSAVCSAEVMVIRAPAGADVDIRCGGAPMAPTRDGAAALDPDYADGVLVGKRYVDAEERFELLCTKGGQGGLTLNNEAMVVKVAKALPSSD
jgi:hypothetical protein